MPLMPEGNLQAYRPGPPTAPLGALIVLHSESLLCEAFVWARRALNSLKRRCPARAVRARPIADEARLLEILLQLLKASRERPRALFHPAPFVVHGESLVDLPGFVWGPTVERRALSYLHNLGRPCGSQVCELIRQNAKLRWLLVPATRTAAGTTEPTGTIALSSHTSIRNDP